MAQYKFRLATLLRLNEIARDERRAQLAEAYRLEEDTNNKIEIKIQELSDLLDYAKKVYYAKNVNVDAIVEAQRYELVLRADHRSLLQQLQVIGEEIERRRQVLIQADRDVRVLEKLRDTQKERFMQAEEKLEVKMMDEIAGRRVLQEDE